MIEEMLCFMIAVIVIAVAVDTVAIYIYFRSSP